MKIDGTGDLGVNQNKPDSETQTLHFFSLVWHPNFLKRHEIRKDYLGRRRGFVGEGNWLERVMIRVHCIYAWNVIKTILYNYTSIKILKTGFALFMVF
jgi:hypothetical protein